MRKSPAALMGDRPRGIIVVALLMVLFGLAEVATGFTHDFFGITTSSVNLFTYSSALIGASYAAAGILIFTMKKRAAALAILLLIADIIGRIALVVAGLYPTDSPKNTFSIFAGTAIVAIFAIYIVSRWGSFRR